MTNEFNALLMNNTWILVPPSTNQHVVDCKWIFILKHKADALIELHKAHLAAKSFHQQAEVYFVETFSLVIKSTSIHTILSLVVSYGWFMR